MMLYVFRMFLAAAGCFVSGTFPASADISFPGSHIQTHTYTPAEPKPAPLDNSFQIASVCFAGGDCSDDGDYSTSDNLCKEAGFTKSGSCKPDEQPGAYCGYNSSFYDRCCNKAYNYTAANCSYPNYLSSDNCSGKHKCLCDKKLFPVSACSDPEEPLDPNDTCREISFDASGNAVSTTYYSGCKCPDDYVICGKNQEGIGEPCQGKYYKECRCKAAYSDACYEFGPLSGHEQDYCLLEGTKYYQPKHCKTCANQGQFDLCPEGYLCMLELCSLKYYISGCAAGYTPVSSCEWMKYFVKAAALPDVSDTE